MPYATANDDPSYARDFVNFKSLRSRNPGPDIIEVYIAVSEVKTEDEGRRQEALATAEVD